MRELTTSEKRSVNGGTVGPYTLWLATYKGLQFNNINPTGVFLYQGYFPPNAKPYKYYCSSAIY